MSYEHYLSEQRDAETVERNKAIVNAMLNKLPESEQTVLNLYYFSGMTAKEIGELLGVSANTITSRLQRAQKRLEKQVLLDTTLENLGWIIYLPIPRRSDLPIETLN